MRSLVYVAGAYAVCMGAAEAFAPQTTVPSGTFTQAKECNVGERTAPLNAWQPYGGYVPESQRGVQQQTPTNAASQQQRA